jgi:hypothetical protein
MGAALQRIELTAKATSTTIGTRLHTIVFDTATSLRTSCARRTGQHCNDHANEMTVFF